MIAGKKMGSPYPARVACSQGLTAANSERSAPAQGSNYGDMRGLQAVSPLSGFCYLGMTLHVDIASPCCPRFAREVDTCSYAYDDDSWSGVERQKESTVWEGRARLRASQVSITRNAPGSEITRVLAWIIQVGSK